MGNREPTGEDMSYPVHDSVVLTAMEKMLKKLRKLPKGRRITKLSWAEDGEYWIVETKQKG